MVFGLVIIPNRISTAGKYSWGSSNVSICFSFLQKRCNCIQSESPKNLSLFSVWYINANRKLTFCDLICDSRKRPWSFNPILSLLVSLNKPKRRNILSHNIKFMSVYLQTWNLKTKQIFFLKSSFDFDRPMYSIFSRSNKTKQDEDI